MWEQIRSNRRKSVVLVLFMALVLLGLGFVIGEAFQPGAGLFGLAIATAIWAVMGLVSYFQGGHIMMAMSGARKIEKSDHPQLFNVVEEMQIAAGMSKMPDIYIIDSMALNAFATGRDPDHAAVAVTAGLLGRLNRDQLQGVIAHEISHVVNRDILFMTMIGVMLGAIAMISQVFLRGMFYSGGRRRRSRSSSGGDQAQIIFMVLAIVLAILAPIVGQVIYFAASRRREYLADANAAVLTRYPEGLASALEAIAHDPSPELPQASSATAPLYIDNPLRKGPRKAIGLFTTHPPIEERVRILRGISGSEVSFAGYQQSLNTVSGDRAGHIPASAMGLTGQPMRSGVSKPKPTARPPRRQMRKAYDAVRKSHGYTFAQCDCGAQLKIPPNFRHSTAKCPRCHSTVAVPGR
jgi:heat shock protein HtpX